MKNPRSIRDLTIGSLVVSLMLIVPLHADDKAHIELWRDLSWDLMAGDGDNAFRYGNWFGPGWWGGSELDDRVGGLPPIDALDAVAQKHDFGYELAARLGRHDPRVEAHYRALADAIAVQDTRKLPKDPRRWNPPAKNPELAARYANRLAEGFDRYYKRYNELKAALPHRIEIEDPAVLDAFLDSEDTPPLDAKSFQRLVARRQAAWTRDYERRQARQQERAASAPAGMRCTCEDWNKDGAFGVVLGGKILHANYGTYQECLELARGLARCRAGVSVDEKARATETRQHSWGGEWKTTFKTLRLSQRGNRVSGYYTHKNGRIEGVLKGNVLEGTWSESGGKSGRIRFVMSDDGAAFFGKWGYDSETPGNAWDGSRASN